VAERAPEGGDNIEIPFPGDWIDLGCRTLERLISETYLSVVAFGLLRASAKACPGAATTRSGPFTAAPRKFAKKSATSRHPSGSVILALSKTRPDSAIARLPLSGSKLPASLCCRDRNWDGSPAAAFRGEVQLPLPRKGPERRENEPHRGARSGDGRTGRCPPISREHLFRRGIGLERARLDRGSSD
jgi:hypothetical protein